MRKLSELLPIARSYLCTVEEPYHGSQNGFHLYTCYSAELARHDGKMNIDEERHLCRTICRELALQGAGGAIARVAELAGVECHDLRSVEYIAFRDKWLDRLQSKLEADEKLLFDSLVL